MDRDRIREENPYEVIGVPPTASEAEIRRAYFKLVREHPPERDPEPFKRIRAAYEILRDPARRAEWNLFVAVQPPAPPHDPVAGHDNRQRVAAHGLPRSAGGAGAGAGQGRQLAVGARLAAPDRATRLPAPPVITGALRRGNVVELHDLAAEVPRQPVAQVGEQVGIAPRARRQGAVRSGPDQPRGRDRARRALDEGKGADRCPEGSVAGRWC